MFISNNRPSFYLWGKENLVKHQKVSKYYENNCGFHMNYSTDFCLSFLNDKILKGFDENIMTSIILIDLQRTFHAVDHGIPL